MTRVSLFFGVVILAASAGAQVAQPTGVISGIVTVGPDALPGVTVTVVQPRMRISRQAVTNVEGRFAFENLPAASGYLLTADLEGMTSAKKGRISLVSGANYAIELRLKPKVIEGCCWIVTMAALPEPGTFVITREMIERLPIE
jgi:carboxypeptidase family protein